MLYSTSINISCNKKMFLTSITNIFATSGSGSGSASLSFAKLRQASPSFAKLHQASPSFTKLRQASPSFAKLLRQASPSFTKLYLALALKKNKKYCFGELGNTTSMNLNLIYLLFRLFKAIYSCRMC